MENRENRKRWTQQWWTSTANRETSVANPWTPVEHQQTSGANLWKAIETLCKSSQSGRKIDENPESINGNQ